MPITHSTAIRSAIANLVADAYDVGSAGPAKLELRDGSTVIVEFDFDDPAFGAAASGIVTLNATPIDTNAIDDGAALDNFVTRDKDGNAILSGSITAIGVGGDIEVTNVNVATGQDCSLSSLTYEAPE